MKIEEIVAQAWDEMLAVACNNRTITRRGVMEFLISEWQRRSGRLPSESESKALWIELEDYLAIRGYGQRERGRSTGGGRRVIRSTRGMS
ncbi:MAG: hypothetical protein NZM29_01780 [Nitrospira sp.]|nr:hypothetical protein [Nitrospira sp.]